MTDVDILKTIRKELRLTQVELGERIGLNQTTLSAIEIGRNPISYDLFKLLVREMGVNPWYFINPEKKTVFLTGKSEMNALKKKINAYEKIIDKLNEIRVKNP